MGDNETSATRASLPATYEKPIAATSRCIGSGAECNCRGKCFVRIVLYPPSLQRSADADVAIRGRISGYLVFGDDVPIPGQVLTHMIYLVLQLSADGDIAIRGTSVAHLFHDSRIRQLFLFLFLSSILYSYILQQINRWIDPLAEHLIVTVKNVSSAADHSAWIMRTLKSNTIVFDDAPGAAHAVRILLPSSLSLSHTCYSSMLISSSLTLTLSTHSKKISWTPACLDAPHHPLMQIHICNAPTLVLLTAWRKWWKS